MNIKLVNYKLALLRLRDQQGVRIAAEFHQAVIGDGLGVFPAIRFVESLKLDDSDPGCLVVDSYFDIQEDHSSAERS